MIAPTEIYTPLEVAFNSFLIDLTSLRNDFFSDRVSVDLSIAFISFNRNTNELDTDADESANTLAETTGTATALTLTEYICNEIAIQIA